MLLFLCYRSHFEHRFRRPEQSIENMVPKNNCLEKLNYNFKSARLDWNCFHSFLLIKSMKKCIFRNRNISTGYTQPWKKKSTLPHFLSAELQAPLWNPNPITRFATIPIKHFRRYLGNLTVISHIAHLY